MPLAHRYFQCWIKPQITGVLFICSDNELTITLWGDHAIDFSTDSVYDEKIGNVIVCLFVGCIPRRDYKDYGNYYKGRFLIYVYLRIIKSCLYDHSYGQRLCL